MIVEDDLMAAYSISEGRRQGDFLRVPATAKEVRIDLMDFIPLMDRQFSEHRGIGHSPGLRQQIRPPSAA